MHYLYEEQHEQQTFLKGKIQHSLEIHIDVRITLTFFPSKMDQCVFQEKRRLCNARRKKRSQLQAYTVPCYAR